MIPDDYYEPWGGRPRFSALEKPKEWGNVPPLAFICLFDNPMTPEGLLFQLNVRHDVGATPGQVESYLSTLEKICAVDKTELKKSGNKEKWKWHTLHESLSGEYSFSRLTTPSSFKELFFGLSKDKRDAIPTGWLVEPAEKVRDYLISINPDASKVPA